jgi:hypothetical protein
VGVAAPLPCLRGDEALLPGGVPVPPAAVGPRERLLGAIMLRGEREASRSEKLLARLYKRGLLPSGGVALALLPSWDCSRGMWMRGGTDAMLAAAAAAEAAQRRVWSTRINKTQEEALWRALLLSPLWSPSVVPAGEPSLWCVWGAVEDRKVREGVRLSRPVQKHKEKGGQAWRGRMRPTDELGQCHPRPGISRATRVVGLGAFVVWFGIDRFQRHMRKDCQCQECPLPNPRAVCVWAGGFGGGQ